jgi:hypothetical protein
MTTGHDNQIGVSVTGCTDAMLLPIARFWWAVMFAMLGLLPGLYFRLAAIPLPPLTEMAGRTLAFFKVPDAETQEVLGAFAAHKDEVTQSYRQQA